MSNEHEAAIDTEIADAHAAHGQAVSHVQFYRKHTTGFQAAERLAEAEAKMAETGAALDAAEAKYEGWSRFFLVQASNGHVHSHMNCSTTYPTTAWSWLPGLSGLTEEDAVEEYGSILCSICFPSAPVEWTNGTNKKDADRKAAEADLKAVAKSPEGKVVVAKRSLVSRHQYTADSLQRQIDAPAREVEAAAKYGKTAEISPGMLASAEQAAARMVGVAKKLAKAEAQLEAAEAALNAALGI